MSRIAGLVPVFNVLERQQRSAYTTFAAFVAAPTADDIEALLSPEHPGVALVEDWTSSVHTLCLRCSYGMPHEHPRAPEEPTSEDWNPSRSIGLAAVDADAAEAVLERWEQGGRGRQVEAFETASHEVAGHRYDRCWWESPEEEG